jgi:hypothetical protein
MVFAKLVIKTTIVIKVKYSTFSGNMPVTKIPTAVIEFAMMCHFFTVSVVSTSGAQINLKMFGNKVKETIGATWANGIPAFVNRKPIVTVIYPVKTPNGKIKNIKILG